MNLENVQIFLHDYLKQELEIAKAGKTIDIPKGSGYISLFVQATDKSMIAFKYPLIALLSMGISGEAEVKKAIDAIETANQELFFPAKKATAVADDKKGVSNRPPIIRGTKRIIGKEVHLWLPKEVQRGDAKGKKQQRVMVRIPDDVPLVGFGILQAWLNSVTSGPDNWVKRYQGPRKSDWYRVPAHNDTEQMKNAKLALAADQEVAPTGTPAQGQGNP